MATETPNNPGQALVASAPKATGIGRTETMGQALRGLIPTTYGEAMDLSRFLVRSDLLPYAMRPAKNATAQDIEKKAATVFSVVMTGMELGLTPMRALKNLTMISGGLAMAADLQTALVKRDGLAAYHDEGYETKGKTDGGMETRKPTDTEAQKAAKVEAKALVADLPDGKHYGWCVMQRTGDPQVHVRVFTEADADRVTFSDWVDDTTRARKDDGDFHRKKVEKKLSEKDNYRNYPQDMYPKRARTRLIGFLFSDSTAGIPATEAVEGSIIDGHVVDPSGGQGDPSQPDVDDLIQLIRDTDPEAAGSIKQGFEFLSLGKPKQLVLLNQHRANPSALLEWLRAEVEQRKGTPEEKRKHSKVPTVQEGQVTEQPAATTAAPAATAPATPATTGRQLKRGADGKLRDEKGKITKLKDGDQVTDVKVAATAAAPAGDQVTHSVHDLGPAVLDQGQDAVKVTDAPAPTKPSLADKAKQFSGSL